MNQKELKSQLSALLGDDADCLPSSLTAQRSKKQLMAKIDHLATSRKEEHVISLLKGYYRPATKTRQRRIKEMIWENIDKTAQETLFSELLMALHLFFKRGLAMSMAFALLFTVLLGPLQTLGPVDIIPSVQAAFMECTGIVYLNGHLCRSQRLMTVVPGDEIKTGEHGVATIRYYDHSVVRVDQSSRAVLAVEDQDQIYLERGAVWLQTTRDSQRKVTTPVLKARIPQGAAGIATKRNQTQVVTTTAAVEVQVNGSTEGQTEVVNVPPQKAVTVQKSLKKARIAPAHLNVQDIEWVQQNQVQDKLHLDVVKKETVEKKEVKAGALPGSMGDIVHKAAQSARTALTWNNEARLQLQAAELDELFAEALVLLEKGDQTTALKTFKAYQEKFTSLLASTSDKIAFENLETQTTNPLLVLFQEHKRLISPFSPEDAQYVLKEGLEELSVTLEGEGKNAASEAIAAGVSTEKLLEAHKTAAEGNIELAEEILMQAAQLEEQKGESLTSSALDTTDLIVLNDIADQSEKLEPIVQEIKMIKVEKLQALQPEAKEHEFVGSFVMGTAYKESPTEKGKETEEDKETEKVVGQAIKEEEVTLSDEIEDEVL